MIKQSGSKVEISGGIDANLADLSIIVGALANKLRVMFNDKGVSEILAKTLVVGIVDSKYEHILEKDKGIKKASEISAEFANRLVEELIRGKENGK